MSSFSFLLFEDFRVQYIILRTCKIKIWSPRENKENSKERECGRTCNKVTQTKFVPLYLKNVDFMFCRLSRVMGTLYSLKILKV